MTGDVEVHGEQHPAFGAVAAVLRRQLRRTGGGEAICVYFRGEPVVDVWAGVRDSAGRPWERDTMAMSFSTTKGVTATALHLMVDRGLVDYDDPVATHWPEFGQAGKERITVRHLLSHQAGLHHVRRMIDDGERMLDWDHMVGALERAEPAFEPGAFSAYHGFTYGWLVGEVVQRVSGRPFADVIRDELATPLGLDGLHVGAPRSVQHRAAELPRPATVAAGADRVPAAGKLVRGTLTRLGVPADPRLFTDALLPPNWAAGLFHERVLDVPIPAANGLFTARSLARLYAALAEGGRLGEDRLLSPRTLERATEVHWRGFDRVVPVPMQWRLGYHRAFTGRRAPRHGFGHFGYGGSGAWADPQRRLAVAMVTNAIGGGPFGDARMVAIGREALRAAEAIVRDERRRGEPTRVSIEP